MNQGKTHSAAAKPGIRPATRQVLIVEDESLIRWSLAHSLEENGLEVTMVNSGEQALEALKAGRFDIVITDLELPQIDGFAVVTAVKSCSSTTPVIMLSALEDRLLHRPEESKRIDSFVEKPFDLKEMVSLVNRLLCKA
jgi:DNA-binding response OmpR family regulator